MSSFSLAVHFLKNCAVVRFPDELDVSNVGKVNQVLLGTLSLDSGIVADMTGTTFCDAAGVRAVVRASDRAEELGSWLRAVVPNHEVRRIFALTGAESLVPMCASIDQALPGGQQDTAPDGSSAEPRRRLVPAQPRYPDRGYPDLAAARKPGEPVRRGTGSAEVFPALTGEPGGQAAPGDDRVPERRTRDLITHLQSECEHSLAVRAQMIATCSRLAATCAEVAATHERLAERRPQNAAWHLSFSQTVRVNALAFQGLAGDHPA